MQNQGHTEDLQPQEQTTVDERELQQATDVLRTFSTSLKTLGAYPKNNPIYLKFTTQLFDKFTGFLEQYESLDLEVQQYSLHYDGHEVYTTDDKKNNIALSLFVDGIRNIAFHRGLTLEEIVEFIDILRATPSEENPEDDIVTMLWERDFDHISHFVPERLGNFEREIEDSIVAAMEQAEAEAAAHAGEDTTAVVLPLEGLAPIPPGDAGDAGAAGATGRAASAVAPLPGTPAKTSAEAAALPYEQISRLRQEAEGMGTDLIFRTLKLFFELMPRERSEEDFREYTKNIARAITILSEREDIQGIVRLLTYCRAMMENIEQEGFNEILEEALARAATPETLKTFLTDTIEEHKLLQYLSILGTGAVGGLLEVLRTTEHRRLRRLLASHLVRYAEQDLTPFIEALKRADAVFMRILLHILGETKNPAIVPHLDAAVRHRDKQVRQSAIRTLDNFLIKEARLLLMKLMNDTDSSIRLDALRALRKHRDKNLAYHLMERVLTEEFVREEPFELKREYFITLGEIGGEEALEVLSQIFLKKTILKREENNMMRAAAAYGLGHVPTDISRQLVEKELNAKDDRIREACQYAMKRLEKHAAH